MSYTFVLSGTGSVLKADYYPSIELDKNTQYVLGLIGFYTYNSVPNIDEGSNKFYFGTQTYEIPTGLYEVEDINQYLKKKIGEDKINISANNNTLKCVIRGSETIDFTSVDSIRDLLGFSWHRYSANQDHESDKAVQILKVHIIRLECNIITNSYFNSELLHNLFTFSIKVGPGISIAEEPRNICYLPINTSVISNITVNILDQEGRPVNFREELISLRLELKKNGNSL